MNKRKRNYRNILATAAALLLAAGLAAVTAPAGLMAAASDSALEAYQSAVVPVYELPPIPELPENPSSTESVYGGDAQAPSGAPAPVASSSVSPALSADTVAPQLSGFTPADGSVIGPSATFSASFYDPEPSNGMAPGTVMIHIDNAHQFGCTITDTSISCNKSGLTGGSHTVQAFACDIDYNCSSSTWYITVDAIAPAVSGNQPTGTINSSVTAVSAVFSDSGSGVNPATAVVTLDGAGALPGCSVSAAGVSCPVTGLGEGSHSASVEVSDQVGNHASKAWTFSVDTAAIGVSGQSPAHGGWQTNPSPTISVNFMNAGTGVIDPSTVALLIDGVDVSASADCQSTGISYTPLSPQLEDGWHTVSVTVQDNAGHEGSSSWSFGVDTTPPVIAGASPTGTTDARPAITAAFSDDGSGVDLQTASITVDGQDGTGAATISTGGISYVPTEALGPGSHNVQLSVGDVAGNQQTAAWSFTTAQAPQLPQPKPASTPTSTPSSAPAPAATTGSQPTLVEYWLNDGPVALFGGGGSWSLTGFQANANAYYLPWYGSGEENGQAADEISIKNQGAGEAIVNIFVAGERRWDGKVVEAGSETIRMPNVTGGPVMIICPSGQTLEAIHHIKNPDGTVESTPAVAEDALESELLLPRYEAPAAGQGSALLAIANVGQQEAAVDVYVGDPAAPESLKGHYAIATNAAARSDLPAANGGPVRIVSTNGQPLVASIETSRPVSGQGIRSVIMATGLTRLETTFIIERGPSDGGGILKLFIANPNDRDLEVELKIAGQVVTDPAEPDNELPVISRQSVRMIDLAGLPEGRIEIDCTGCNLGEGLLAEGAD
jgi:hypothetical protein